MPGPLQLPTPQVGESSAVSWVQEHLTGLSVDDVSASPTIRGGQTAADQALAAFGVAGYAVSRSTVQPAFRRGASRLSPYIRHGLLDLPGVWHATAQGPRRDVERFHDELMWQEYARHLYARLGARMGRALRAEAPVRRGSSPGRPWQPGMACMEACRDELEVDGWLVNQTRMWMASQWSVRHGLDWRDGERYLFTHLLDGSRAANTLGWQWTVGTATGRRYGFSRWQVEKRAPSLCAGCGLAARCPIETWPDDDDAPRIAAPELLRSDPDPGATAGPRDVEATGRPEAVWLTAESLGDDDPALAAHPDLPAIFVFDAPMLGRLRLSGKRLVFLAETLAHLASRREVRLYRGEPVEVLTGRRVATTFAPVPGWRRRARAIVPVEVHPWRWLRRPDAGTLSSFTAWRKRG